MCKRKTFAPFVLLWHRYTRHDLNPLTDIAARTSTNGATEDRRYSERRSKEEGFCIWRQFLLFEISKRVLTYPTR